jgi:hypothetical protein
VSIPIATDKDNNPIPNILLNNIVIGVGNNLTKIEDNTVKIYSADGKLTFKGNELKTIKLAWYNKDENGKYIGFEDGAKDENGNLITCNEEEYLNQKSIYNRLSAENTGEVPADNRGLAISAQIKETSKII